LPLSDRDYMQTSRGRWSSSQGRSTRGFLNFGINPVFAIIAANLVVYIAMLFSSNSLYPMGDFSGIITDRFTYYLGLIPYYFTERPWTIFTAMFIHGGFWHLFFNMLVLFFFGSYLSRLVGNSRFTIVYFVGGLAGNLLYLVLGDNLSVAVGASGAIYAAAGALAVLVPNLRVYLYFIIPMPLWMVVLIFGVGFSFVPGVAWQAHIGGLVVGLLAGFYFRRKRRFVF
jgi:membrane associated rhomboid family serine protease